MILVALFVAILLLGLWGISSSRRRRAASDAARLEALTAAAYAQGVLDAASAPPDGPFSRSSFPKRRSPPEVPIETLREGYWRRPPVEITSDEEAADLRSASAGRRPEICFTGWSDEEKAALFKLADERGFKPRHAVTKNLTFLCCGKDPGPVKLRTAKAKGCALISGAQFEYLSNSQGVDPAL